MGREEDRCSEERFEQLLGRADMRSALRFEELRELARLYRLHTARLSRARSGGIDPEAVRYLNALCVRAHAHVHADPVAGAGRRAFFSQVLPDALARTRRLQLVASLLLASGILVGGQSVARDPGTVAALVPAAMYSPSALHELSVSEPARARFLERKPVAADAKSVFGAYLFANNTRVGILSFATGVLLGVPTVLLLLYNGLTLGAFAAVFVGTRHTVPFLAWIIPHGVPELLAIVLCAAGGLHMALSLWSPERDGWAASLRRAARDAAALVLGSLPLFVTAALIESFVRQSLLSTTGRFVVAAVVALALMLYVLAIVRRARRLEAPRVDFLTIAAAPADRRPTGDCERDWV